MQGEIFIMSLDLYLLVVRSFAPPASPPQRCPHGGARVPMDAETIRCNIDDSCRVDRAVDIRKTLT